MILRSSNVDVAKLKFLGLGRVHSIILENFGQVGKEIRQLLESKRGRLFHLGIVDCGLSGAEILQNPDPSTDYTNSSMMQFSGLEWLDISGNRFKSAIKPLLGNCL